MLDRVRATEGQVLRPLRAYLDDSDQYWSHLSRCDKLERLRRFRQPGDASWDAFAAGRGLRVLRRGR